MLGLANEDEVRRAYAALQGTVLVERMAPAGVELIVGGKGTPFGPVVMVGAGGVLAELVRDTALALAPMDNDEALRLLEQTRVWQLLTGYRGQPACDVAAIVEAMVAVSRLICDLPVGEIEVNPLVAYERGVLVLDALVRA